MIVYPGSVFNVFYSVCPENRSEVLNTAQLKVEQPQDKRRLGKSFNLSSNLTGPEIQKIKQQIVDTGELTEVRLTLSAW